MKQYKRLLAAGLMVVMIASLTGCATNNKTDETVAENIESVTETTDASTTGTADAGVVHIATKPMTEQFILGEMLSMLIEQAGYKTEITKGVGGGTNNIQPAMESGEFDLYPEYTSSGWVLVLNHEAEGVDDDAMFEDLKKEYEENFDMTWIGKYGFKDYQRSGSSGRGSDLWRKPGLYRETGWIPDSLRDLWTELQEGYGH